MMKAIPRVATFALLWAAALCAPAFAQILPELRNSSIDYSYTPPKSLKYLPLFERLKQFRMLEQLAEFLSPLRLPHKYTLGTLECGVVNAYYSPGLRRINLCYEFVEMLERIGPKKGQPSDFTYEEAVVGAMVAVILHENGHAAFDMFDVPVFGREEDAADEMSAFIALQFSPDVARKVVKGFAYWAKTFHSAYAPFYSDEHGTGLQRYYNTLCIAFGSEHSELFKEFVDKGGLPKERAASCPREYGQIKAAFAKTVFPFIDQAMMKKVQARQWLDLTPQQAALLNQQQQQQTDTFTLSLCNRSAATKVHMALGVQLVGGPQDLQALGWFAVPDGGCDLIGTFRGDRVYWYAEGVNNNRTWVWSAADTDQTALRQCINPVNAFQLPATTRCQSGQKLISFRRWNIDSSLSNVTITLR
jgi:hypothetical protein